MPIDPKERRPEWLKIKINAGENYRDVKRLMRDNELHTVCEEAHCPNIGECFENRTATFLILGNVCTRSCSFCAIGTGRPGPLDWGEPERVLQAVQTLKLKHVVITSVNRDERKDGGSPIFYECVRLIREHCPGTSIELLIPDFKGDYEALKMVMDAGPDILNHNTETVPRLYRVVRPQARYERSLELLRHAKELAGERAILTKTGIMVGVGENWDEILQTMRDIREQHTDIMTIGQYLRPSLEHLAVEKYYHPDEFAALKRIGLEMGFKYVESGPLVRSSYHAHEQAQHAEGVLVLNAQSAVPPRRDFRKGMIPLAVGQR
jgi:lipoic acid synthetase